MAKEASTQVQFAQVFERMGGLKQNVEDLKKAVDDHRTEHRLDNEAIKKIVTDAMDKIDLKFETHGRSISAQDNSIAILKRDHTWMKGIFTAAWAGVVAWVKFK